MSREAFEKWYAGYFGCEFGLNYHGDDDLERAWQAATEATKPKWIPYKDGDVIEDGWYLVTIFYAIPDSAVVVVDHRCKGCWDIETYGYTVTAYMPLPAPYVSKTDAEIDTSSGYVDGAKE